MTTCPTRHPAAFCWKRNLVCVWAAQLFSIMGFAFAMSFSAYYIQSLGVRGPDAIKLWTGIRPIFLIEGVLLLGLLPLIAWVALRSRSGASASS